MQVDNRDSYLGVVILTSTIRLLEFILDSFSITYGLRHYSAEDLLKVDDT